MSKQLIAVLVGLLTVAAVAAGCGSSSDGESSSDVSTTALTKAEFIKQGDAICGQGDKQVKADFDAYVKQHNIPKNQELSKAQEEELIATVVLPSIETQVEGLDELGAPSGEESKVNAIVDGVEEAAAKAKKDPGAVVAGNDPFVDVDKLAKEYGFKVCGQS